MWTLLLSVSEETKPCAIVHLRRCAVLPAVLQKLRAHHHHTPVLSWTEFRHSVYMTARELDTCFRFVAQATGTMLCTLEWLDYPWLPGVRKWRKKTLVLAALRRAVEKGSSRQVRLERVAFFYCWLSSLNLLPVWTLFRFTVSVAKAGGYKAAHLVEHMASALRVLGHRTTFTVTEDKTAVYGCILVDDPEPRAPAHVICVCLWCKLPYMAVYAPNEKIHSDLGVLLAAVLDCDPRHQVCGIYDDLDSAKTKALYDALLLSHGNKPVERSLREMT